jgi:hypothetical protein
MNIFVLDENPVTAAKYMDDVRLPKMCVESAQMMAASLRRHGATDEQMPLTKAGKPYKGGYKHHPCTIFAGDSRDNFMWLSHHALALCDEYIGRFNKVHACHGPIKLMSTMLHIIPEGGLTPFAQAMPDEYKDDDVVKAYRSYYKSKQYSKGGVRYMRTDVPTWWEVTA